MGSTIVFSAATMWFYDTILFNEYEIPKPYKIISNERHMELLKGAEQGMKISTDESGDPILIKSEVSIDDAMSASKNTVKERLIEANGIIAPLLYLESLGMLSETEADSLSKWRQYTIEVSRADQQIGWPNDITWPVRPG
ncbi:tail fiber assembly protein [Aeromonas salmonicida]|uniref:tail fiber assembly protein n=1 Tax=Aeromonas salmonicida TaxID=645 RepID=UPI0031FD1A37